MPGICGVIDLAAGADALSGAPPLDAMIRPLVPHPWFAVERCEELPGAQLAAVSLVRAGRLPHVGTAGSVACVLDGEFYNARELAAELPGELRRDLSEDASHAALLLAGWSHGGEAFLRKINGSFSAVLWDAERRVATLLTDRFGNRPLYYALVGERLLFSSRLKSLTLDPRLSRQADPRGLAQFFTFGHYLGGETSLAAVKVLPAAACWSSPAARRWCSARPAWPAWRRRWLRPLPRCRA